MNELIEDIKELKMKKPGILPFFYNGYNQAIDEVLKLIESHKPKVLDRILDSDNMLDYLKHIENTIYEMTTYTDIQDDDSQLLFACIQKIRDGIKWIKANPPEVE